MRPISEPSPLRGIDLPVPDVDVIIVAFGPEPLLESSVQSALDSEGVDPRVLLVDNGCTNDAIERLRAHESVTYLAAPANLGFAGGVMLASSHLRAQHLALVNSDVIIRADVLRTLVERLSELRVGIVMPLILRRDSGLVNSAGNPLHLLAYSWAGNDGTSPDGLLPRHIAVASGAMLALRRETWERIGGLAEEFFLYHEDVDLSIACRQAGLDVVLEPSVSVSHDHDWNRNPQKIGLSERNRLVVMLTRYPASVLIRLLPLVAAVEVGSVLLGGIPGVRSAKLRGYLWLIRNRRWIARRRRANLRMMTDPVGFLDMTSTRFDASAPSAGLGPRLLDRIVPMYARLLGLARQQPEKPE
jgi:GT2 family glycosyltransferase